MVDLQTGRQVRRHQDHLQIRYDAEEEEPQTVEQEDNVSSFGDGVVVPENGEEPSGQAERQSMQEAAPSTPRPERPQPRPVAAPVELRRSQRQDKPNLALLDVFASMLPENTSSLSSSIPSSIQLHPGRPIKWLELKKNPPYVHVILGIPIRA